MDLIAYLYLFLYKFTTRIYWTIPVTHLVLVPAGRNSHRLLQRTKLPSYGYPVYPVQDSVNNGQKIVNSKRVCTVTELLLRYMDLIQLRDKRWFYRPVEAYYIGYKDMPKK